MFGKLPRYEQSFLGFAAGIFLGVSLALGSLVSSPVSGKAAPAVLGTQTESDWVLRHGSRQKKQVALTFDDGPGPATLEMLDVLAEYHVPATFFVVGRAVERYPAVTAHILAEGHEVGNHTYSHPIWKVWLEQALAKEIVGAEEVLWQTLAVRPKILRSPYGLYTPALRAAAESQGMVVVGWDVDPEDWRKPGVEVIVQRILKEVQPGSIILLHDGPTEEDRSQTVAAIKQVIPELQRQGYTLVGVSSLR